MRLPVSAFAGAIGVLTALASTVLTADPAPADLDKEQAKADEQTLQSAKVATDGPALLDYFRKKTLDEPNREKILQLIRKLGDDSFAVREQATNDLVAQGAPAIPLLAQVIADKSAEIEVIRRAERCLEALNKVPTPAVAAAAARMLGRRNPPGAVSVLLAYLPSAEDQNVVDAIRQALTAVAVREGKPEPALVAALGDKLPLRRATAGEALIRCGLADQRAAGRKLLEDADSVVRLRAALALVEGKDKDRGAIPVLIAAIRDLPQDQGWLAEEVLLRLAGDQNPSVPLGREPAERQKCSEAWSGWWARNGDKINLARLDDVERLLNYTLVVQYDIRQGNSKVAELGPDKKPRWQLTGLQYPIDARVLPGDRILIAEYTGSRVTERNLKGEVVWEKRVPSPVACQRLPNGNTFIAGRTQLVEVDREGKEVKTIARPNGDVRAAQKLRNGEIVLVTSAGQCVRMDANGKELKTFAVGTVYLYTGIDVLPNNRVLIPHYSNGRVAEYDAEGKTVWQANVPNPTSVVRLPNGNTLVGCSFAQRVIELDRAGKTVWEYQADSRVMRVRRR